MLSTDFEYDLRYESSLKDKKKGILKYYRESNSLHMSYPELLKKFVQREDFKTPKN